MRLGCLGLGKIILIFIIGTDPIRAGNERVSSYIVILAGFLGVEYGRIKNPRNGFSRARNWVISFDCLNSQGNTHSGLLSWIFVYFWG